MKRWMLIAVALALTLSAAVGAAQAQGGQARVRAVHASPGAPAVDLLVNGNSAFGGVNYKDVTDYAPVNAGTTNIQVVPSDNPQSALFSIDTELEADTDYTIAVVGRPGSAEPLVLVDDNSPPPPGQTRLRFVHASPNAPAVDVVQADGTMMFSNVSFKQAAGYTLLPGGTRSLEVREAGTSNVVLALPDLNLPACNVHTIWVMGLLNEQPPLEAVTSTDATTTCATPVPGATVAPGGRPGAAPAITQPATMVTGTPRAAGTKTVTGTKTGTVTTATPGKTGTRATVTKVTTPKATVKITKVITPKATLQVTKVASPKVTLAGTVPGGQATLPAQQPTSPPGQ